MENITIDEFNEEFELLKEKIENSENTKQLYTIWSNFMKNYEYFILGNKEAADKILELINTDSNINDVHNLYGEVINNEEESKKVSKEEYDSLNDKYQRLFSEFDNFRKRTKKEKNELIKTSNEKIIIDLIETIDNFERARRSEGQLSEGIYLTYENFLKTLKKHGVEDMEVDEEIFDSDTMDALTKIVVSSENKGKVIETIEKGYRLGDKIIRFPKVIVGV